MGRGHFYYMTCKASLWSVSRGPVTLYPAKPLAGFFSLREGFHLKTATLIHSPICKERVCFRSEWCERKAKLFGLNKVQDVTAWDFEARNTTS